MSDDLVIPPPPGVESWSENLFCLPFDYDQGIGFASHCGRSSQDANLWREFLHVFLPDGRALVAKTYGRRDDETERKVGGAHLQYECLEPFERWHLSYDGVVRDTTQEQLFSGAVVDGPSVRFQLDVQLQTLHQPWAMNTHGAKAGGGGAFAGDVSFHYEQVCDYTGTMTVAGETFTLNARGFRDHTRGVRKFQARSGHTLLSCAFADGLKAGLYEVRAPDGAPNFSLGFTAGRDGVPHDAEVVSVPRFAKVGVPDDFTIVIRAHDGEEIKIEGHPLRSVPMTFYSPNDHLHGIGDDPDYYICLLSPASVRRGDIAGTGHLELSTQNALR